MSELSPQGESEEYGACDDEDGGLIGGAHRGPRETGGFVGRGGARERARVSPSGGNGAERTLRRRKPADFVQIINAANQE